MRRDAGEERARRVAVEPVAGQAARRAQRRQPEPQHRQRMSRDVDDRPEQLAAELPGIPHERPEQPPPRAAIRAQAGGRRRHRPLEHDRAPTVQRVRDRRVRMDQLHPARGQVDRGEERRCQRQRQDRRAHVVAEPGQGQLHRPRPATGLIGRLVDTDRAPGTGQRDGRRQAVGSRPDDDRVDPAVLHVAMLGTWAVPMPRAGERTRTPWPDRPAAERVMPRDGARGRWSRPTVPVGNGFARPVRSGVVVRESVRLRRPYPVVLLASLAKRCEARWNRSPVLCPGRRIRVERTAIIRWTALHSGPPFVTLDRSLPGIPGGGCRPCHRSRQVGAHLREG